MPTILVPLDGSYHAQQALPAALSLASREQASLLLLGVDENYEFFSETAALTSYFDGLCGRIRAAGWEVTWQVLPGNAAETIASCAHKTGASLIVMSSHGRRGLTRWTLGSVTERVARAARCEVLVVRTGTAVNAAQAELALGNSLAGAGPAWDKVLIALDGSARAELPLERAQALAGHSLELLSVLDFPPPVIGGEIPSGWAASVGRDAEDQRMRYLEGLAGKLRSPRLEVKVTLRRGAPADEIVEAAAGSDLLVMTNGTRPWLERLVTGSVASRVTRHSPCPVLLVPASAN